MFHDAAMQNIFFRIVNFIALLIVGYILFKQKALPAIKKRIQEKTLLLSNLEQQRQGIKYQHNNIDSALEQQEHLAKELTKKIGIWKRAVDKYEQRAYEERTHLQEKMEIKNTTQQESQVLHDLNEQVLPEALDEIERKLQDYFSNEQSAQRYLHDIITFIKKES